MAEREPGGGLELDVHTQLSARAELDARTEPALSSGPDWQAATGGRGERAARRAVHALEIWWPLLALAGAVAFAAVFELHYGLAAHYFQPDELGTVQWGRGLDASFFHVLFAPLPRGPERLTAIVFALPGALLASTPDVFRAAHVLFSLIYLSAVVPVYVLARGLGLERWQALFPAAASILTPWMLFGGTMLNTTVAYPSAMALAWATWRAAVRPGWRGDALVLVCALVATVARVDQLLFLAVAGLAVVVQVWRDAPVGETLGARARAYPLRLLRAHPLLCAAAGLAVALVLALGVNGLIGSAYTSTLGANSSFTNVVVVIARTAAEFTMGTGYLPVIIGLPWLLRELVRPRGRESGAFALVALGFFAVLIATIVYSAAGADERYVAVLAGLPALAAALALFRRQANPLGVALAGVVVTRAIVTQALSVTGQPYDYFVAPARVFFVNVMQGQASTRLPFEDTHIATTVLLTIVALGVAAAYLSRRRRWLAGWVATACASVGLAAPVALGATAGVYVGNKFEQNATSPGVSFDQLSFADVATGGKTTAFWDYTTPHAPSLATEDLEAYFFNGSVWKTMRLSGMPIGASVGEQVMVAPDLRSGRLSTAGALPSYILAPVRFTKVGFAATQVAGPVSVLGPAPLVVERLDGTPHLAYAITGTEVEGWIASPGHSATIRLYPSDSPRCWRASVLAPPTLPRPIRYSVSGPGIDRAGRLGAGASAPLLLRAPRRAPADVRVAVRGTGALTTGVRVAAGLGQLDAIACPG